MIIVLRQRAQISNRLVSLAALMGFCLRNKIRLQVFSLSEYQHVFQEGASVPGITVGMLPIYLHRLINRVLGNRIIRNALTSFPSVRLFDQQHGWSDVEVKSLQQGLWIIDSVGDWCASMPCISDQEATTIRQVLRYQSGFHQQASALHAELRKGCDLLIGVHARRGDYATHRGGCWFYTEADYLRWIDQAAATLRETPDQRVHFIVCSNEPQFLENTNRADVSISRLGSAPADQILLSMCDLIVGPPSTFSVWAAFLSNTALLHISDHDQVLAASQVRRSTLFYGWEPRLEVINCT
jgi:hypothetical protein